jgi:hypothetical protein
VDARAIAASLHRFVSEVPGHDALGELGAPGALEAHEIVGANRDHSGVAAATGRAGQAIELFGRGGGQAPQL